MSWGLVGAAAVSVVGGYMANKSANKGAQKGIDATNAATMAGIDENRRQFDLTRNDQLPWLQAGQGALGQLQALNSGNYSGFMNSPDYLWARDQGMEGINRQLAAHGSYYSGGGDADRMKFLSGLATQNLGNYRGALQSMAGLGQSTASGLGALGMNMAGQNAGLLQANGQARSSLYQQMGNNNAGMYGGIANVGAGLLGNYFGNRQTQQVPATYGGATPVAANGGSWLNAYGARGFNG